MKHEEKDSININTRLLCNLPPDPLKAKSQNNFSNAIPRPKKRNQPTKHNIDKPKQLRNDNKREKLGINKYQEPPDEKKIEVMVDGELIYEYILEKDSKITDFVHQIIGLICADNILGYISNIDFNDILGNIEILRGKSYADKIAEQIKHNFKIYDIDEKVAKLACQENGLSIDNAVKVACLKQGILKAIVTSPSKSKIHECIKWQEKGINILQPEQFINWYASGFKLIVSYKNQEKCNEYSDVKFYQEHDDIVESLNKQIDETLKQPCIPLPQIGYGWFFDSFEVLSSDRSVVTASIKIQDRRRNILHTFPATGDGTINALFRAVDVGVSYLTAQKFIKKALPTIQDIWLFHISDKDRQTHAKVDCRVILRYERQYYIGECNHTDTIKAALYAYALALNNALEENPSTPNSFLHTGKMIQRQYEIDNRRIFVGIPAGIKQLIRYELSFANFSQSDFSDTIISCCGLANSTWYKAKFVNANLTRNDFTDADLSEANLTNACLNDSKLTRAKFLRARMFNANLTRNDFTDANLSEANLTKADLSKSTMRSCNLINAQISQADLSKVNFSKADFTGANLTHADLTGANLTGANLTHADLTGANLTGANLTNADLTGTILDMRYSNLESQPLKEKLEDDNSVEIKNIKVGRKIYRARYLHQTEQ